MSSLANKRFSAIRSCDIASAASGGAMRVVRPSARKPSSETFPNRRRALRRAQRARAKAFVGELTDQRRRNLTGGRIGRAIEEQKIVDRAVYRRARACARVCPPPTTPMVMGGRTTGGALKGRRGSACSSTAAVCAARCAFSAASIAGCCGAEDRRRSERGVGGARLADGERRHRHAGGHLHDRQQRIETVECFRLHRHAEHRHGGFRGDHAGKMGGATGAGDDEDAQAARFGGTRIVEQEVGRAGARRTTTHFACGTPMFSRQVAAGRIVSQSEREPMMMPTSGFIGGF
jgi:hypothetical protein